MFKSFRFLWQFSRENLTALLGFAAIVVTGAVLTNAGQAEEIGVRNLFSTYYGGFSLIMLMVLFMVSASLCTANLNMAVSFGARRRDYFWGVQLQILVYTLFAWLVRTAMCVLPQTLRWTISERYQTMLSLGGMSHGVFLLIAAAVVALGALSGVVTVRSRVWGSICVVACLLIGLAATVLLLITGNRESIHLWGDLPVVLTVVMAVVFAAAEALIWRITRRYCVR